MITEFTTAGGCTVKVYPEADGNTMLHFSVKGGHFFAGGQPIQQAFIQLDPASRAALRAALIPDYSDEGVSQSDIKTALDETHHAASLGSVQTRERRLAGFLREILDYYPLRDQRAKQED